MVTSAALTAAKATYTIGEDSADMTMARPTRIAYGDSAAYLASPGRGAGYAVNDTGTIAGGTGGTYLITATGPGGAVTAVALSAAGSGYTTNATAATATGAPSRQRQRNGPVDHRQRRHQRHRPHGRIRRHPGQLRVQDRIRRPGRQ